MTESTTNVRLVRCPKCQNLLPELADYSVYQCGGCGAVLRAKTKLRESAVLLEKSAEEKVTVVPAKSPSSSERGTIVLSDASDTDINSNSGCEDKSLEKKDVKFAESIRTQSKGRSEKWAIDSELNGNTADLDNKIRREQETLTSQIGSGRMSDWRATENVPVSRFPRAEADNVRFSAPKYPDEGSSGQNSSSSYAYGFNRVQHLEHDRAELLKKLDELREQITRSCAVADEPKERMGPQNLYGVSNGPQISEKHIPGLPFIGNRPDLFPFSREHGAYPGRIPNYGDTFGSQMINRAPEKFSNQHPYYSGQYIDPSHNPYEPFRQNTTFHQPSCSCYNCYQRVSAPPAFHNNRFSDLPSNPIMYHSENPAVFGSHSHNVRTSAPPMTVHGPQPHSRWPSDVNLENNGFSHFRPPRNVVLASSGTRCRPVAGGAPFLTCHNCFELLKLPKKVKLIGRNQQRLRCGACSTVISFTVADKKLILSDDAEVANENTSFSHDRVNRFTATFSSDDYDSSGYDFQTLDPVAVQSSSLSSGKPQEMQTVLFSSSTTSEDENSPDVLIPVQQPLKSRSPSFPDSPVQDNSENNINAVSRFGKGNRSSRSEQETVMPNKVATRQNSLKDTPVANEMDMSFTECSKDSGDSNREESQPRTKGGESFFANIIKKSFKDFSRSNQHEHPAKSISINGHVLPDRLIKKAEKQAGQIHPGQYWYDFRAGFWGVMGRPCLGIIPPFIEEFNYPMPQNCAAGNTSVFVNGRELHQKDLDLLANRGLPVEANRSYIIEINGRVLDEDTGEELDSLGKLAPTVERMKHGFGMKVPKTIVP
ncbi:hypothetical protein ACFE04_017715 [Oxalis oulophora]